MMIGNFCPMLKIQLPNADHQLDCENDRFSKIATNRFKLTKIKM